MQIDSTMTRLELQLKSQPRYLKKQLRRSACCDSLYANTYVCFDVNVEVRCAAAGALTFGLRSGRSSPGRTGSCLFAQAGTWLISLLACSCCCVHCHILSCCIQVAHAYLQAENTPAGRLDDQTTVSQV